MSANLKENISLSYYTPLSDEKSAVTVSHRDFNDHAWWSENCGRGGRMTGSFYFMAAGCPSVTRQSVVQRQIPTSPE